MVTHVSRCIPHIATQYRQRRYSVTDPFSIEIVDTEVRAMIQGGQIDQARSSAAGRASSDGEGIALGSTVQMCGCSMTRHHF